MKKGKGLQQESKKSQGKSKFGQAAALGTNFAAGIAVMGYLGHLLDKKTGKTPRYTAIGCLLGVAWGMYEAIKLALSLSKEEQNSGQNEDKSK